MAPLKLRQDGLGGPRRRENFASVSLHRKRAGRLPFSAHRGDRTSARGDDGEQDLDDTGSEDDDDITVEDSIGGGVVRLKDKEDIEYDEEDDDLKKGKGTSEAGKSVPPTIDAPPIPPTQSSRPPLAVQSTTATTTTTEPTTVPTTIAVVSTTAPPEPSSTALAQSTPTLTTTTKVHSTITQLPIFPVTSSQARNGLDDDDDDDHHESTHSADPKLVSSTAIYLSTTLSATALSSVASVQAEHEDDHGHKRHRPGSLSPTAHHVLIALGTIGVTILVAAATYLLIRLKKKGILARFRHRETHRGEDAWVGWCSKSSSGGSVSDAPLKYPGRVSCRQGDYSSSRNEESLISQKLFNGFFSRLFKLRAADPQTTTASAQVDTRHHDIAQEGLLRNPAPLGTSQYPAAKLQDTTNAYGLSEKRFSRASYLSSLSSGFGDAQFIIPEPSPKLQAAPAPEQNYEEPRKFSWVTTVFQARSPGNRDTIHTTSSEGTPRFRTISSWVAQQTGRLERQQQNDGGVPEVPVVPTSLQDGGAYTNNLK